MLAVSVLRCYRANSQEQGILRQKVAHVIIIGIFLLSGISELFQRMTIEGYRYLFTVPFVLITAASAIIAYITALIRHKLPNEDNIPIWFIKRNSIVGNIIVLTFLWVPNGILQILYYTMKYEWVFVPQHSIQLIFSVSYIFVQRDVFQFGLPSVCFEGKASHTTLRNTESITLQEVPRGDGPIPLELLLANHFVAPLTTNMAWPSNSVPHTVACCANQNHGVPRPSGQANNLRSNSMYNRSKETMQENLKVWPLDRSWPLLAYNILQFKKVLINDPKSDV